MSASISVIKVFNFEKVKKKERKIRHQRPENLIRRTGGLKKRNDLRYADFEHLYRLWSSYYKSLLEYMNNRPDERILKADYHGCILRVADSMNPSQIGLNGIVIHESKSTFQMITHKDRVIIVPKEDTTFHFALDGRVFTIFGNAFLKRSYMRGRKAKSMMKIPFFLK